MTFEEFEKLVNVTVVERHENFELRVSMRFSSMRCVPKDRLDGRVKLDDIEMALKLQLWEYMQKQVGHTDGELDQAYSIGFMDGINNNRRDYNPEPYRERVGAGVVKCGHDVKLVILDGEVPHETAWTTKPLASE